jgi:hypothetical protein
VRKDDPDGQDFMQYSPEGYPLVGSTILMKMPLERYIRMRGKELAEHKRKRGDAHNVDKMLEVANRFASKYGKSAPKIIERFSPDQIRQAQTRASFRRQRTSTQAWQTIDTHPQRRHGTSRIRQSATCPY